MADVPNGAVQGCASVTDSQVDWGGSLRGRWCFVTAVRAFSNAVLRYNAEDSRVPPTCPTKPERSWKPLAKAEASPSKYPVRDNALVQAGHFKRTNGFTLLEVCVVLFIVAVIFVVAVPPATHLMAEENLQRPIRELQSFAKTARRKALMEDRAYAVLLLDDGYVLQPVVPDKNGEPQPMKYQLPSDVSFEIKRAGDREFKRTADARWIFSSNGLCEPLTFLFQQHGNWVRFGVDPLTATVQQQESFIK